MKNILITLSLLIILGCTNFTKAQKAYDIIIYKSITYGTHATLQLADGYMLASKVTIKTKFSEQVFAPTANEPNAQGDLRFDPVKSNGRYNNKNKSWLTLKKLNGPEYPSQIKAVYRDGKLQKVVVFSSH